jgi:ATP-dependent DNA helicase RecQ
MNAALHKHLRDWRKKKAAKTGMPAYIIMHDTTLEDLCFKRPSSLAGLREVLGFGERKTELYGPEILQALREFEGMLISERDYSAAEEEEEKPTRRLAPGTNNVEAKPRRKSGGWWGAR